MWIEDIKTDIDIDIYVNVKCNIVSGVQDERLIVIFKKNFSHWTELQIFLAVFRDTKPYKETTIECVCNFLCIFGHEIRKGRY